MPVDLEFDYDAVTSQMDIFSQEHVNGLREWTQTLDNSKYVPKDLSDKQLVIFYNACYGDMDKTKTCIERYYNVRKNAPEFFENRSFSNEDLRAIEDVVEFAVLPGKSVEGYDVLFHRLHDCEPSKYRLEHSGKLMFMTIDACLSKRGPQPGYMFLFDMRGVRLGHITRVSLTSLRKFFQYVQEALPVRMRAIHVLNTEPILDKVLLLIRPFMDKKFFDMIKFHHKEEDLEKFYETVVPRSLLPPDYGGTLPDTQTLHAKCMQQLKAMDSYFKAEEAQRIAALPDKKREKALERSFQKLEID